jgi:hypothetical protein
VYDPGMSEERKKPIGRWIAALVAGLLGSGYFGWTFIFYAWLTATPLSAIDLEIGQRRGRFALAALAVSFCVTLLGIFGLARRHHCAVREA